VIEDVRVYVWSAFGARGLAPLAIPSRGGTFPFGVAIAAGPSSRLRLSWGRDTWGRLALSIHFYAFFSTLVEGV